MEVEDLKVSSEPETTNETTGEPIYPGKRKRSVFIFVYIVVF
jgi:hypothetical protein